MKIHSFLDFFSNLKPEKTFLWLAWIAGSGMLLLNPLFRTPDTSAHLNRAYQVSVLHFLPQKTSAGLGGYIPRSIAQPKGINKSTIENIINSRHYSQLSPIDKIPQAFPATALYSPIVYIPQALGLNIGRLLSLPPIDMIYLACLGNLLFWITIIYWAIKIIPAGKWALCFLALTPIVVQQASSLSADTVTNGLAFLVIALIVRLFDPNFIPSNRYWLIVLLSSAGLALSKQPFFLICWLLFFIPKTAGTCSRLHWQRILITIISSLAVAVIWALIAKHFFEPSRTDIPISLVQQVNFILLHPLTYLRIIHTTFSRYFDLYLQGFIGNLDWLNIPINWWAIIVAYVTLFWVLVADTSWLIIPNRVQRVAALSILSLIIIIVVTLIYLSWCSPGADIIEGIQARYFIPASPLLCILFANKEVSLTHKNATLAMAVTLSTLILFCNAFLNIYSYYKFAGV